jgi:hypothetical protein
MSVTEIENMIEDIVNLACSNNNYAGNSNYKVGLLKSMLLIQTYYDKGLIARLADRLDVERQYAGKYL